MKEYYNKYYNKYINEENKFDTKTMIAIIALIIVFSGIFGIALCNK